MKKLFSIVLAFCLLAALSACNGTASSSVSSESAAPVSTPAPAPSSVSQPEASLPENAESKPAQVDAYIFDSLFKSREGQDIPDLPEFLPPDLQDLYYAAYIVTMEMNSFGTGFGSDFSSGETIQAESGAIYTQLNGAYKTWAEFKAVMDEIFTPECFDQLNGTDTDYPHFIDHEGSLYMLEGGRGSNIFYEGTDTFKEKTYESTLIQFDLVGHYNDPEGDGEYTESYPIEFVLGDNGTSWLVSEFAIAF